MEYSWDERSKYVHKFTLGTCDKADCFNARKLTGETSVIKGNCESDRWIELPVAGFGIDSAGTSGSATKVMGY